MGQPSVLFVAFSNKFVPFFCLRSHTQSQLAAAVRIRGGRMRIGRKAVAAFARRERYRRAHVQKSLVIQALFWTRTLLIYSNIIFRIENKK